MIAAELKSFYETPLGNQTCRELRHLISRFWPYASKEKILGLGFALPYLPLFSYDNSCVAFTLSTIGAMKVKGGPLSAMAESDALPAQNDYFDRVIIIHGLEMAEIPEKLIEEAWRVLKPTGKLLLIAPNENGLWRKFNTPFRGVKSYSRLKMAEYLVFHKFTPRRFRRLLFFIPTGSATLNKLTGIIGAIFLRPYCGALAIEAEKLIFSVGGRPIKIPVSMWDRVLKPKPTTARGVVSQAEKR